MSICILYVYLFYDSKIHEHMEEDFDTLYTDTHKNEGSCQSQTQNAAVGGGDHDPNRHHLLWVGVDFDPQRQPHLVTTTTNYLAAHW